MIILSFLVLAPSVGRAEELSVHHSVAVQQTITKALPYLWSKGEGWIEKRGCVSCHQVPTMLWSLSSARHRGFEVDSERLRKWQEWSVTPAAFVQLNEREELDVSQTLASNIDTLNMLLLAADSDRSFATTPTSGTTWKTEFASALIQNQAGDGSWLACGQLPAQKRPKQETTQVTVMWTLLTLKRQDKSPTDRESALAMTQNDQPLSTEYVAVRLLLSQHVKELDLATLRRDLIDRQNEDGGWVWLTAEPSDPLATGMAIYALRYTSQPEEIESSLAAADQFLLRTQRDDGSWNVPGTKQKTRDKPTPTSNYWGTGWAVIGLLE
ncbi:MAG: squalene--hopene cyclase [Planctomycetota bacterium]|nr:squalene--hopene cyclase [Planctomycetota bacterium]